VGKNLKLLRVLVLVVVFGGLIVLATRLQGAAAVVVWVIVAVGILAAIFLVAGTKPSLRFDDATKQVFAQWQAGHPDRRWGWVKQDVPAPRGKAPQDPALLGRITMDPPVIDGGRYDRMIFLGKTEVDGHGVLVMERGYYSSQQGYLRDRITVVSVDTPGMVQPVCFYRRSGFRFLTFGRFTTGDADFDARFQVDAENRAAARRLLSPEITRFLRSDPRAAHVGFTFEHGALSVWLNGKFDDVNAISPMIDLMMELYNRIPAQVWSGVA
jgi:hypothetical protein